MSYAKKTKVPVEKSRMAIDKLLVDHGADQILSGFDGDRAIVGFRMHARYIRITLPLNNRFGGKVPLTEQQIRSRWRALGLVIKAKLEAVVLGVVTFEEEFLAHVVMPDNRTIGAHVLPRIAEAYKTGKLPALLPAAEGRT